MMTHRFVLLPLLFLLLLLGSLTPTRAQTPTTTPTALSPTPGLSQEEVDQKKREIEELQRKLNEISGQKTTLSNTISYINTKIALQQTQINQTQAELNTLVRELEELGTRIDGLEQSLTMLSDNLVTRVQHNYKQKQSTAVELLMLSDGVTDFLTRYRYQQMAQEHTRNVMAKAENQRMNFDEQKRLKEIKQEEIERKKVQLSQQKQLLTAEKANQQRLLDQTNNDEAKYQQLLAAAEAELSSFRSFATSRGTGVLPPQNSPDGWFFSQRDERWAGTCIGSSCGTRNEGRILEVGCLVSSTAMVKKKYGEDVNPVTIARNPSYFFSTTAYMLQPWPAPSGYYYQRLAYNQSTLDKELAEGRPVIAHMKIGTRDGHFLVIKSGSQGNYIIHDPIEGYDKKLTDFYKISQINNLNILRKN